MKDAYVSVVMPAYNATNYIERTIRSLQEQSHTHWELIVVDDCSSDGTGDLVARIAQHDQRIKLISLEKNFGGPAGPRNVGVEHARFDLIAFLDSDDIWHPQKLEEQLKLIDLNSETFICSSMTDFENDSIIEFPEISRVSVENIGFLSQSFRAKIPTSSVLLSKRLISQFPFEESPAYKAVEDFHCWLRILESGVDCKKIKEPLLYYRRSEGQISGSKLKMMKKVFMVHKNYEGRRLLTSILFTASHILGGVYFRFLKKGM